MAMFMGAGQNNNKRPGSWIIPVVLVILSVLLITISVRVGNTGAFAAIRSGVQTVTAPLVKLGSNVSSPFRGIGTESSYTDDEVDKIVAENKQLKTLVAQLEEYRQQDQRLTTLLELSDTYGLQTVSGKIIGTTDGWNQVSTINVGSADGISVGMGVISSCGLYGQVETVGKHSATVRLITDASSSVSAMVQTTRETGILKGSYDGNLVLEYVSVDSTVGEGDVILTSGKGGTYPRGIVIGTVKSLEIDSSKLYYRIVVEPILNVFSCEEVLVLTGQETETANLVDTKTIKEIANSVSSVGTVSTDESTSSDSTTTDTKDQSEVSDGIVVGSDTDTTTAKGSE